MSTETTSPKRKLGGTCGQCGAAILKRKRHCDACAAVVAERERKVKAGFVTIRTSTGSTEVQLPRAYVHKELVFSASVEGSRSLGADACCGVLLDSLLALTRAKPPYITEQDVFRYMALLCDLKEHCVTIRDWAKRTEHTVKVAELPLTELERGLRSWCEKYLRDDHPLMSSYALDAAEFILNHAYGAYHITADDARDSWRIEPMLASPVIDTVERNHGIRHDSRFKREVTQRIGGLLIQAKVPSGGRVIMERTHEVVLGSGGEFLAKILRCHLSQSFYDWTNLTAVDDAEPRMSLSHAFRIPCEIRVPREEEEPERYNHLNIKIPARWITHVLIYRDYDKPAEPAPVPDWLMG